MQTILQKFQNKTFTYQDCVEALKLDWKDFQPMADYSESVCEKTYKKNVFVRGIIEFSNYCKKNCLYCGIRRDNFKTKRYRMSEKDILLSIKSMYEKGFHTVVLQSGEDSFYTDEKLISLLKKIKSKFDIVITLSIGERSYESYEKLKDAGADRFLLRIETTDEKLFKKLHPDDNLEYRKQCLFNLKKLGYEVGTGIMVGLPNQSLESIVKDIFFFKELDADMIGIGPFLPHQDTPLAKEEVQDFSLTLKVLSLIRILLPTTNLPATTAMGTIDPQGREKALEVGANVIMPNATPQKYRPHYTLYDNKICIFENSDNCAQCTELIVQRSGKKVVWSKGFRKSNP